MSKLSVLKQAAQFLGARKKWWLFPVVIFLVLLSVVIVLSANSALAPFIYALF